MTTAGTPLPLQLQQAVLHALDQVTQQAMSYQQTAPVGSTPDVQARWIGGFDAFSWQLLQLYPRADWLLAQGYPESRGRLDVVWNDWTTARQTYVEMLQSTVRSQAEMAQIWQGAIDYSTNVVMQTVGHSQQVFNRSMEQYFDVTEDRCFDCHTNIGIPGGGYCLTCARRRGMIL